MFFVDWLICFLICYGFIVVAFVFHQICFQYDHQIVSQILLIWCVNLLHDIDGEYSNVFNNRESVISKYLKHGTWQVTDVFNTTCKDAHITSRLHVFYKYFRFNMILNCQNTVKNTVLFWKYHKKYGIFFKIPQKIRYFFENTIKIRYFLTY